jgi:cytochrome bd ubiquinol oxidase subunit II
VVETWFALLCFTLTMFAVLDGWNFGAGALHLVVARTDPERREVVAALGPLWSWHEVWLIAAGGTFLLAFPKAMATAFAGYYLALWIVLWCFILRGIAIEVGGHFHDRLWQPPWDLAFSAASVLLAILFGAAIGNVIRGVPIDATGKFSLALFTNWGVRGDVGILDWYTLSTAVYTLLLVCAHGATYLAMKTRAKVHERSDKVAGALWVTVLALLPVITAATWYVRPDAFSGMAARPLAWLFVLAVLGGAGAVLYGRRAGREAVAFGGSCAFLAGLLGALAVGVFPVLLYSTIAPEHSMTAAAAAAGDYSLRVALFWWPVALVLALGYAAFVARFFRGKVGAPRDPQPESDNRAPGALPETGSESQGEKA